MAAIDNAVIGVTWVFSWALLPVTHALRPPPAVVGAGDGRLARSGIRFHNSAVWM